MPAVITAIILFISQLGPALEGLASAVSVIMNLIKLFHGSANTVAGKAAAMKTLRVAVKNTNLTGNTTHLMNAIATLPTTVTSEAQ